MLINLVYESELFTVLPIAGEATEPFFITTKDLQLPIGVYKDTIYVHALKAKNNPYLLEVTLNVIAGTQTPQIHIMDSNYLFIAREVDGLIPPTNFVIQNRFGGCMEWHIDNDIPWAFVFDTTGNVPDTVDMFSAYGLTFGQYSDSFYITSPVASNSPRKVKLVFKVWKLHGDNNFDGKVNILDLTFLVDYIFRNSGILPQPVPLVGDVNCDDELNILDLTYLVDRIFRLGPPPCGN
jgi:hypothetical protein